MPLCDYYTIIILDEKPITGTVPYAPTNQGLEKTWNMSTWVLVPGEKTSVSLFTIFIHSEGSFYSAIFKPLGPTKF